MNKIIVALALTVSLGAVAGAQTLPRASMPGGSQALEPAPVPNRDMGGVEPSDRAGRPDGSERAAPFSGLPNTMGSGTGQDTPATTGSTDTRTSPSPSLSR